MSPPAASEASPQSNISGSSACSTIVFDNEVHHLHMPLYDKRPAISVQGSLNACSSELCLGCKSPSYWRRNLLLLRSSFVFAPQPELGSLSVGTAINFAGTSELKLPALCSRS